jgi:hypothetical protein
MRTSQRRTVAIALVGVVVLGVIAFAVFLGPGAPAPSPSPSASPAPTPTPDPHLVEPADANDVFHWLVDGGLEITANNADTGGATGEPRLRINSTYDGWPLIIAAYSSGAALRERTGFDAAVPPVVGDAPFTFVGLNMFVEYGPHNTKKDPPLPEARFQESALKLGLLLHPLIGPLEQRSVVQLPIPTPVPSPTPSPEPGPSGAEVSPEPSP